MDTRYTPVEDGDRTAEWFHQSPGTVSTFRTGWMEYEVKPFFQCYPVVNARLEVLPLQSEDGEDSRNGPAVHRLKLELDHPAL